MHACRHASYAGAASPAPMSFGAGRDRTASLSARSRTQTGYTGSGGMPDGLVTAAAGDMRRTMHMRTQSDVSASVHSFTGSEIVHPTEERPKVPVFFSPFIHFKIITNM